MNVVDSLIVALELNTDKFDNGLESTQKKVSKFSDKVFGAQGNSFFFKDRKTGRDFSWMVAELANQINYVGAPLEKMEAGVRGIGELFDIAKDNANGLFNVVRGIAASTLFTAGVAWIAKFVNSFKDLKKEVAELHSLGKQLNEDVGEISAWSNAIEYEGGSIKGFQGTLKSLKNDMLNISVMGRARTKPIYEQLGIDTSKMSGKSVFSLIKEITKAIEGMDKTKSRDILQRLGFDSATIELMQKGSKEIDKLIKQQKEWGTYTKKDTEALDKMEKEIKRLNLLLKSTFIPLFTIIIRTASKFITYFRKGAVLLRNNINVIRRAVLLLAVAFSGRLLKAIQQLGVAAMNNPFMVLVMAITALVLILEDLWVYANNGKSALRGFWKNIGSPKEVLDGFKKVGEWLSKFADFITSDFGKFTMLFAFIAKGVLALAALFGGIPVAIGAAIALGLAFIVTYWEDLKASFEALVNMFIGFFGSGGVVHNLFSALGDAITDFLTSPVEKIKTAWADLKTWFVDNFSSISAITSRLSNYGASAQLARDATGGGGSSVEYNDNKTITINPTNAEASNALVKGFTMPSLQPKGST